MNIVNVEISTPDFVIWQIFFLNQCMLFCQIGFKILSILSYAAITSFKVAMDIWKLFDAPRKIFQVSTLQHQDEMRQILGQLRLAARTPNIVSGYVHTKLPYNLLRKPIFSSAFTFEVERATFSSISHFFQIFPLKRHRWLTKLMFCSRGK